MRPFSNQHESGSAESTGHPLVFWLLGVLVAATPLLLNTLPRWSQGSRVDSPTTRTIRGPIRTSVGRVSIWMQNTAHRLQGWFRSRGLAPIPMLVYCGLGLCFLLYMLRRS